MVRLFGYVDVTDTGFIVAVLSIAFNPFFWNVVRTALCASCSFTLSIPFPASFGRKNLFWEVCWAGWGELCSIRS